MLITVEITCHHSLCKWSIPWYGTPGSHP